MRICLPVLRLLPAVAILLSSSAFAAGNLTGNLACDSPEARLELKRQAVKWMKNDQMLDEMADIGTADLSLSRVAAVRKTEDVLACKALLTMRVTYSAGLRRTIDNDVTYDLRRRDDEGHVAVKVRSFGKEF